MTMGEVESAIRDYQAYTKVEFGSAVEFSVRAPEYGTFDSGKTVTPSSAATDAEPAQLVRALTPPTATAGQKRSISFDVQDRGPSRSLAYVFYRNLFLFKVRATVLAAEMSEADFNAMVDLAVQTLLPAIEVDNFGTCGNITVALPEKTAGKQADAGDGALQIATGMGRVRRESCAASEAADPTLRANYARETIVYPAGTWK